VRSRARRREGRSREALRARDHDRADATALLYELRATASLCRIGGRPARDRLSLLLARFGPDDDCADLRAARAML
jgi:hypothetical protein